MKQHLNTSICECGHQMTARDKTSPLTLVNSKKYYGGNVKAIASGQCPECNRGYQLWLRQHKNSWQVMALVPFETESEEAQGDEFDSMDRDALKGWLDAAGVEYTQNWGEKRLRELCREYVLSASV